MPASPPRPLVVLVHGFPGGASDFGLLGHALIERGWDRAEVLAPDLRGFGLDEGPYTFDELWVAAQAERLEARIGHRERGVVLVGHDVGGPIALALAHRIAPDVRGLVLMSCNLLADPPLPGPFRFIDAPILGPLVRAATLSRASIRAMAVLGRRSGPVPRPNTPAEVRSIRTIFATALADPGRHFGPVQADLSAYEGHVTHVIGRRDPFFTVKQAAEQAALGRASRLEVLEGVGHFPQLEAPARLATLVEAAARGSSTAGILIPDGRTRPAPHSRRAQRRE